MFKVKANYYSKETGKALTKLSYSLWYVNCDYLPRLRQCTIPDLPDKENNARLLPNFKVEKLMGSLKIEHNTDLICEPFSNSKVDESWITSSGISSFPDDNQYHENVFYFSTSNHLLLNREF